MPPGRLPMEGFVIIPLGKDSRLGAHWRKISLDLGRPDGPPE